MNNKKYAIFAVLVALGALEFSQIEVPADFDLILGLKHQIPGI